MSDFSSSSMRYVQELSANPEMAHRKIISRIAPGTRILEFGSSAGVMTRALSEDLHCEVSIVEIDPEAFDHAEKFAIDGFCGDIESFEWEKHFGSNEYDYILFVDVLEHLRNSREVLRHCLKLLKEDGSILISVPNIAHNSVIIQLLQNQIIYQNTGILDYTHVHYFTFSELEKMCIESGYRAVYVDATYIAVGKNEFDISYKDIDPLVAEYLRKRPFGEVYQHIIEVKRDEYVRNNNILLENHISSQFDSYTNIVRVLKEKPEFQSESVRTLVDRVITSEPNEIFGQNNEVARLRNEINDIYEAYPSMQDNAELIRQKFAYQEEVREKNNHIRVMQKNVDSLNLRVEDLQTEEEQRNNHIRKLDARVGELSELVSDFYKRNRDIQNKWEEDKKNVKETQEKLVLLNQEILNRDGHIEQLLEKERIFNQVWNSKGVRICRVFWNLKEWMFPKGSKRRLFMKFVKKFIKHPIRMLKKCTPSRIKRTLGYMATEDISMIETRLELSAAKNNDGKDEIERIPVSLLAELPEHIDSFEGLEKIVFAKCERPRVSIIIPVYNQFAYTYNCLKSIEQNSGEISYEVILADDCSTDITKDISSIAENLIISKTEDNCRFLLNCNHAAKEARGEFILFLNNDTQVQDNWLEPLVSLMDKDSKIGMTGSMLLYPDGSLQEAGGIVWKDASAWNYGNQRGPKESEFNYVRETDYISGAAIMIRKKVWEEIGGFDIRFAPAYCEDSDLAFEVRKRGFKVVYQPLSKVVHFEGVSNGTDTSRGLKSYQVENSKKFLAKWKETLDKENYPNGTEVFAAKDRSRYKKHILVVDHYVPMHDKDAGGKTTFMYLKLFVKMGFQVTFIGDNFYPHEPYTTELNQMGIEVLYGDYYSENWQKWLSENGKWFDYVYLQRPHISIKYIDAVRKYTQAKIFYYAHDLHHIREYREYEMTGDEEKIKSSERWKQIEYELFTKADIGHVVGTYEEHVMQEALPDKLIHSIPAYMYEKMPEKIEKDFSKRKDIMYVGGFGHPPNIDAVLWFGREVFPKVLESYPEMIWYVAGSKVTDEIQALASKNIRVLGFVSDEDLEELYRNTRIDIAPLRVGAGVKGKVVEAAYYQTPLVTTDIGGEGLDVTMGNMVIANDADSMAAEIISLYEDHARLKEMSDAGEEFIKKYFTYENAEMILRKDMGL